jgi:hypothetical protein
MFPPIISLKLPVVKARVPNQKRPDLGGASNEKVQRIEIC